MSANVEFENLRAEMGRKNVTIGDMASVAGVRRETMSRKLSRAAPINLDEAFAIVEAFFPEHTVEYLFREAAQ